MAVELLINESQLRDRLAILGREIEGDYQGKPLTIVAVLTGSLIALADLVRQIRIPLRIALVQASSYRGATTSATTLVLNEAFAPDVAGRDVLLLDDILDTGQTLSALRSISGIAGRVPFERPFCCARSAGRSCRSSRIIVVSSSLMLSWSGMDLTSTTSIGIYRMWECCGNNELAPLKLALVTRWYPPLIGGAEKVFYYLAGALAAEGANVTVVTSQKPGRALSAQEEVSVKPNRAAESVISTATGRLSVVRLETSRLRFWGTWRYMRNLAQWFEQNAVDLAYVSMLKHDAYVAVRAGKRMGFPVVLRPEGAGATGDVAWQSWGRFGRKIGLACRQADAIISISKAVEVELRQALESGTMRPVRAGCDLDRRPQDTANRFNFQWCAGSGIAVAAQG